MSTALMRRLEKLEKLLPKRPAGSEPIGSEYLKDLSDQELDQVLDNLRAILLSQQWHAGIITTDELAQLKQMPEAELLAWLDRREADVAGGHYQPQPVPSTFAEVELSGDEGDWSEAVDGDDPDGQGEFGEATCCPE